MAEEGSPLAGEGELRLAIARSFADHEEDETAYAEASRAIRGAIRGTACTIAYVDGWGETRSVGDGVGSAPDDGPAARSDRAAATFGGEGGECDAGGALAVESGGRPFGPEELALVKAAADEIGSRSLARQTRARRAASRQEAEKELRRSEERLRTFFEESRDMIYTVNGEDVVASVNQAGIALLGLRDRFEIIGLPMSRFLFNEEDREIVLHRLDEEGYTKDFEMIMKRADGRTLFCIETAQAVKDRNGKIIEVLGIVKDITERMKTEQSLWQTNLELSELNSRLKDTQMLMVQQEKLASIGQLAAGIAHEINNPLGFLRSNHSTLARFTSSLRAAWVQAAAGDPAAHAAIASRLDLDYAFSEFDTLFAESEEGFRRIMEIVQNLKTFARIDRDAPFGPYDLDRGIASSLIVARNELKYVAEVEFRRGGIAEFDALGNEVNQVILNLLVNAGQAIAGQKRQGLGSILVQTSTRGGMAVCEISDDGPGVPEQLRLRIFDPFFTTKAPGKGTGLGLSISYDIIVNKHGGRLSVGESDLGGALFTIELPMGKRSCPDTPDAAG